MHVAVLLAVYCVLCVVSSLVGGWIPLVVRLTHRRMQIAVSFVSGIILGIGLLHLLPHSYMALGSIDASAGWTLVGFLFMFFLERFLQFHHHDVPDDPADGSEAAACGEHDHGVIAGDEHPHADQSMPASIPWGGAIIGLALHGLVDGLAIAAAVAADQEHSPVAWAGLGTALAVILHKPFDALTIGTLMAAAGHSASWRHLLNALFALATPAGVLLFFASNSPLADPQHGLGQALGFAAGAFICIATSDLLPELQFHRHDRLALSLALVAGIALAWSAIWLEESGHDHQHVPPAHAAHHD